MLTFLEVNGFASVPRPRARRDWILGLGAGATPETLAQLVRLALIAID